MSKKRQGKTDSLVMAKSFRDLLLYEISGGNMGKKPEHDIKSETTFSEKSAFLDKMIKIAALEHKGKDDEEKTKGRHGFTVTLTLKKAPIPASLRIIRSSYTVAPGDVKIQGKQISFETFGTFQNTGDPNGFPFFVQYLAVQ